jgi:hypothetical protein
MQTKGGTDVLWGATTKAEYTHPALLDECHHHLFRFNSSLLLSSSLFNRNYREDVTPTNVFQLDLKELLWFGEEYFKGKERTHG